MTTRPEHSIEYNSIWLANGSDTLTIRGVEKGVQIGKAAPGAGLEGAPRVPKVVQNNCFKE